MRVPVCRAKEHPIIAEEVVFTPDVAPLFLSVPDQTERSRCCVYELRRHEATQIVGQAARRALLVVDSTAARSESDSYAVDREVQAGSREGERLWHSGEGEAPDFGSDCQELNVDPSDSLGSGSLGTAATDSATNSRPLQACGSGVSSCRMDPAMGDTLSEPENAPGAPLISLPLRSTARPPGFSMSTRSTRLSEWNPSKPSRVVIVTIHLCACDWLSGQSSPPPLV